MRPAFAALLALTALSLLPSPVTGQSVAWDGPSLVSPHSPQGLSVLLVGSDPGDALGVMGQWRHDRASLGLAYRGGVVQDDLDDLTVFAGVDVSGILATSVEDADIQVSWWTGLGASLADELLVSIPAGLVVGWRGLGDGNVFAPYAGAHVTLDAVTGPGEALSLDASVDLGLDLTLVSGWIVRAGVSLFGRGAVAVGIRVPS